MLDKGHSLDENQNKWWIKIVTGCSDNVVSFKHLHLFKNPYKSSNLHHLHLLRIENSEAELAQLVPGILIVLNLKIIIFIPILILFFFLLFRFQNRSKILNLHASGMFWIN